MILVVIKEFARAHAILADGLPLETLLEICSQSDQITKAERRAAERKSHKAKQQADRHTTLPPTEAEPTLQSGFQGDERQEAASKSPFLDPNSTGEESGTGDQGHLGAKLGLAMSGLAMAGAGESADPIEEDATQPAGGHLAQAGAHEGVLQPSVRMRQSIR
jgi:hypothetical protein